MKKPDDGKLNRKNALSGCGFLLSPFLLLISLVVLTTLYNNFQMWQFEKRFLAISHPPQSKFVARTQEIGTFGNGNHIDFLVAEVRSFTGSQNAVQNFYKSTRIRVPNGADDGYSDVKNGTQPVEIEFLRSPLPAKYHWKFADNNKINLSSVARQKNLYVVFIDNSGESYSWNSMFDWR